MLVIGGIVFFLTDFPMEYWLVILLGVALFSAVLGSWAALVAKCPNCGTTMSYEVHPKDPQKGLFVCMGCSAKWQTTVTLRKKPTAGMDRIDI